MKMCINKKNCFKLLLEHSENQYCDTRLVEDSRVTGNGRKWDSSTNKYSP